MRELDLSHAVKCGLIGEIVAFDQDPLSLAEVEARARRLAAPVKCVEASVTRLIAGRTTFADFDFVYAAGLFDYLNVRAAKRLARAMFTMLRPGGRMLIPNFLSGISDMGYMETYMDWDLIYRDRAQIENLAADLVGSVENVRYFEEAEHNIGFLLVQKSFESHE